MKASASTPSVSYKDIGSLFGHASDSLESSYRELQHTFDEVMSITDPCVLASKGGRNNNDSTNNNNNNNGSIRRGRTPTPVANTTNGIRKDEGVVETSTSSTPKTPTNRREQQRRDLHDIGNGIETNGTGSDMDGKNRQQQHQEASSSMPLLFGCHDFSFTDGSCGPIGDGILLPDNDKQNEDVKSVASYSLSSILGPRKDSVPSKSRSTANTKCANKEMSNTPTKVKSTSGNTPSVVHPSPSGPFDESSAPPSLSKTKKTTPPTEDTNHGSDNDDDDIVTDNEGNGHEERKSNKEATHSSFLSDAESIVKNLFFGSSPPSKDPDTNTTTTEGNTNNNNNEKKSSNNNHNHLNRPTTQMRLVTRRKNHPNQGVGVDVAIQLSAESIRLQQEQQSSSMFLLVVSKIQSDSIFAGTDLQVGDVICSINGVSFWDGTTATAEATTTTTSHRGWGTTISRDPPPPTSSLETALSLLGDQKVQQVTIGFRRLNGEDDENDNFENDDNDDDCDEGSSVNKMGRETANGQKNGITVESVGRGAVDGRVATGAIYSSPSKPRRDRNVGGGLNGKESKYEDDDDDNSIVDAVMDPSSRPSIDKHPPHRGLWARALRLDRNKGKKSNQSNITPKKSNANAVTTPKSKESNRRITSIGSAMGMGRGRQSTAAQQGGQSPSHVPPSPKKETTKTNRGVGVEGSNRSVSPTSPPRKKGLQKDGGSATKSSHSISSHSRTSHSRSSQSQTSHSTSSDSRTCNSRLEDLRSKNQRLRANGQERIVEARKSLLSSQLDNGPSSSTSIASSLYDGQVSSDGRRGDASSNVEMTEGDDNDSSHSPEDLATQLRHDSERTRSSGGFEKERYGKKVRILEQPSLLSAYETTEQLSRPAYDTTMSSASDKLMDDGDYDDYDASTNNRGCVATGGVPNKSMGTSARASSLLRPGPEQPCPQSSTPDVNKEMRDPPAKLVEVSPDSISNIKEPRELSLLDDSSVSAMEYVGLRAMASAGETVAMAKQGQQELGGVKAKVVEMLRARIEQLKRNNMALAEEIARLRDEDSQKANILNSMQSRLVEAHALQRSLNAELELSKSRFSISTIQADNRQHEFFAEIEKLKSMSDSRTQGLKERVGALERANIRLATKLQKEERERDSMAKANFEMEGLKKKISDQAAALDAAVASKDELQARNQVLERALEKFKRGPDESSEQCHATEIAVCTARISFLEKQVETLKSELSKEISMAPDHWQQQRVLQPDTKDAWRQWEVLEKQPILRVKMESDSGGIGAQDDDLTGSTSDDSCVSDCSSVLVERILEIESALKSRAISLKTREMLQRRLVRTTQKLAARNVGADVSADVTEVGRPSI